jgi:NitT/TauT family transport system permease protein
MNLPRRESQWLGTEWIGLALIVMAWEIAGRLNMIQPAGSLPPLTAVLAVLADSSTVWALISAAAATAYRALGGLAIAIAIGVPLGLFMGGLPRVGRMLRIPVELLRMLPPIAIIPVAILFLGIFDPMKIAVVAFGATWPIVLASRDGVLRIDRVLIDTARCLSLSSTDMFFRVVAFAALPSIIVGIRISLAISLIVSIAADMLVGSTGLGFLIIDSERSFRTPLMYASLCCIALLGGLFSWAFDQLLGNRRWPPWVRNLADVKPPI